MKFIKWRICYYVVEDYDNKQLNLIIPKDELNFYLNNLSTLLRSKNYHIDEAYNSSSLKEYTVIKDSTKSKRGSVIIYRKRRLVW